MIYFQIIATLIVVPIRFHIEPPLNFQLKQRSLLKKWLQATIQTEQKQTGDINFIFCTDDYLHNMNVLYLSHDTLTDVITFDYSADEPQEGKITGDIFISIDRVTENADKFGVPTLHELRRVMVHGVLHLLGYHDKTAPQKTQMHTKEDEYLAIYNRLV